MPPPKSRVALPAMLIATHGAWELCGLTELDAIDLRTNASIDVPWQYVYAEDMLYLAGKPRREERNHGNCRSHPSITSLLSLRKANASNQGSQ